MFGRPRPPAGAEAAGALAGVSNRAVARKTRCVFGSKAIGEPPLIYGEAAWFAIKDAIESLAGHRLESGLVHPATPEAVLSAVESLKNQEDKDTR